MFFNLFFLFFLQKRKNVLIINNLMRRDIVGDPHKLGLSKRFCSRKKIKKIL